MSSVFFQAVFSFLYWDFGKSRRWIGGGGYVAARATARSAFCSAPPPGAPQGAWIARVLAARPERAQGRSANLGVRGAAVMGGGYGGLLLVEVWGGPLGATRAVLPIGVRWRGCFRQSPLARLQRAPPGWHWGLRAPWGAAPAITRPSTPRSETRTVANPDHLTAVRRAHSWLETRPGQGLARRCGMAGGDIQLADPSALPGFAGDRASWRQPRSLWWPVRRRNVRPKEDVDGVEVRVSASELRCEVIL